MPIHGMQRSITLTSFRIATCTNLNLTTLSGSLPSYRPFGPSPPSGICQSRASVPCRVCRPPSQPSRPRIANPLTSAGSLSRRSLHNAAPERPVWRASGPLQRPLRSPKPFHASAGSYAPTACRRTTIDGWSPCCLRWNRSWG
jgi:hypothetical protein